MTDREAHEQNRLSWNAATERHHLHRADQVEFFRNGGDTLFPEEKALIGDLSGARAVHLQCNAGQDTLSLARHHGADVTGVDISDSAIRLAGELAKATGIAADFVRADVVDWCHSPDAPTFDLAFVSYGALTWLSDLKAWGSGVAKVLAPGGRLVLIEFHPAIMALADGDSWEPGYDYLGGAEVYEEDGVSDYVGEDLAGGPKDKGEIGEFENPHPSRAYCWGVAESIDPLIKSGLQIEHFEEHAFSNAWRPHPSLIETEGRRFTTPPGMPNTAMMFSVVARKPL